MNGGGTPIRVTIVALAATMGALLATATTSHFSPTPWEYSKIAENFLAGRGLSYTYLEGTVYWFYGGPLYPLLLAGVAWVTGSEWMTLILQAGLFGGTAALVYGIARRYFGATEATVAAVLVATHPGNLYFTGQMHSQILGVFSITLAFALLVRCSPAASPRFALATALAVGAAVLCRGPMLAFVP